MFLIVGSELSKLFVSVVFKNLSQEAMLLNTYTIHISVAAICGLNTQTHILFISKYFIEEKHL